MDPWQDASHSARLVRCTAEAAHPDNWGVVRVPRPVPVSR
jgi:hypothetical protein